jgi:hypothetical protein
MPVLLIPVELLWKVQIGIRQKLALAGIFSLTLFIIDVAITRVTITSSNTTTLDLTWILFWGVFELTVGTLTVTCVQKTSFSLTFVPLPPHPPLSESPKAGTDKKNIYDLWGTSCCRRMSCVIPAAFHALQRPAPTQNATTKAR